MKKNSIKIKKSYIISFILFITCFLIYSMQTLRLFRRQVCSYNSGFFSSDMGPYMLTMAGLDQLGVTYPIFFKLGAFLNLFMDLKWACALATAILNSLSMVVLVVIIYVLTKPYYSTKRAGEWAGVPATLLAFSLMAVSMLFLPDGVSVEGIETRYMGVFSPNPYHNATYLAARPFAIVTFFLFVKILKYYEGQTNWKEFMLFGISLLVTTMTKPSFTLVFMSAAFVIMVWRLIRAKGSNIVNSIKLGLFFLPTVIDLLYQYSGMFTSEQMSETDNSIRIGIGKVWSLYSGNIPVAIVLGIGFPIAVGVFYWKKKRQESMFSFAWLFYIMSMLEFLFLYETGPRMEHANFAWGYMYGMFFIIVVSAIYILQETIDIVQTKATIIRIGQCIIAWGVYGMHLVCGMMFLWHYWLGSFYVDF